jgi:hypothetical protein
MFEEKKPFSLPLPPMRFEYYRICQRTFHFDGYLEVDSAYYSAPPRYDYRRSGDAKAAGERRRGSPRDRHAPLRARFNHPDVEPPAR